MTAKTLTIGEALVDIVHAADGTTTEYPGGSPMNVAVALGRLGHESHLLACIGDDARGRAIQKHVEASHVILTPHCITDVPTSTALAELDDTGAATYTFDLAWDPDPTGLPDDVDVVHTSSIGAVLDPGAATVLTAIERLREHSLISYDPNARPDIMGAPELMLGKAEALMRNADLVKSSDEDLGWFYPDLSLDQALDHILSLGPKLVIITRGVEGAFGVTAADRVAIDSVHVDTVDTVGAGDTFSAGLIDGLSRLGLAGASHRNELGRLSGHVLTGLMRHAASAAAITVSRAGANPPWREELERALDV